MKAVENRPNNPGNTCFCVLYMHLQSVRQSQGWPVGPARTLPGQRGCRSAVMKVNTEQQSSHRLLLRQVIRQHKPSLPVVKEAYDMTSYSCFTE